MYKPFFLFPAYAFTSPEGLVNGYPMGGAQSARLPSASSFLILGMPQISAGRTTTTRA